jgi:hypothetical protein
MDKVTHSWRDLVMKAGMLGQTAVVGAARRASQGVSLAGSMSPKSVVSYGLILPYSRNLEWKRIIF